MSPLALITGWWAHRRASRKQSDGVAIELVKQLQERLRSVEQRQELERQACAAELKAERHRRVNLAMCVDQLLTGYDLPPDKMAAHVARVRTRLDRLAMEDSDA